MNKTKLLAVRVDAKLLKKIDKRAIALSKKLTGISLTRSDAVRSILESALGTS